MKTEKEIEEAKENLGQAIDRLDNLVHALQLPLSAQMHVDALRSNLPEVVKELKEAYEKLTDENPWV
jgi:septation ring formation regulator EzrA